MKLIKVSFYLLTLLFWEKEKEKGKEKRKNLDFRKLSG